MTTSWPQANGCTWAVEQPVRATGLTSLASAATGYAARQHVLTHQHYHPCWNWLPPQVAKSWCLAPSRSEPPLRQQKIGAAPQPALTARAAPSMLNCFCRLALTHHHTPGQLLAQPDTFWLLLSCHWKVR